LEALITKAAKNAVMEAFIEADIDPFKDYPVTMKELDVCDVLGKGKDWLHTNLISAANVKAPGKQIDFSKRLVQHKYGGTLYFLKREVRQYYNRLALEESLSRHE
jgi:hypothetical protein